MSKQIYKEEIDWVVKLLKQSQKGFGIPEETIKFVEDSCMLSLEKKSETPRETYFIAFKAYRRGELMGSGNFLFEKALDGTSRMKTPQDIIQITLEFAQEEMPTESIDNVFLVAFNRV